MNSLFDFTIDICIEDDPDLIPYLNQLRNSKAIKFNFAYLDRALSTLDSDTDILYLSPNNNNTVSITAKKDIHNKNFRRTKEMLLENEFYDYKLLIIKSVDQLNQFLTIQSLGFTKFENFMHIEESL